MRGVFASQASAAGPVEVAAEILEAEQDRLDAVARAMPSTVCVFVPGGGGGGSGVLISTDGFALTNFHVSSPAGTYMRCGLSDGNVYDAVVVGVDPVGDLALIKLLGRDDFPVAALADSRKARVGDWCMVIGNPFLLATNLKPTVSFGILSGVGRYQYPSGTLLEYGDCLQTDAAVNPGNSGGPLYDAKGDLLGIVGRCSFEKRGRVNVGVGYAISVNQAKNFLGYLHSGRVVDHATLGATVQTDPDGGVRVTNILEFSDVYRRGVRYGAEILQIDGRAVATANDVQNVLATLPAGWRVKLSYRFEGKTVDTVVRLSSVHQRDELLKKMASALPPPPPTPQRRLDDGTPDDKAPSDEEPENQTPKDQAPDQNDADGKAKKRSGKSGIPSIASELIEDRRGYANYYFNRRHQDRLMQALHQHQPGASSENAPPSRWVLETKTIGSGGDEKSVSIVIADSESSLTIDDTTISISDAVESYNAVEGKGADAILAALKMWQRLLRTGSQRFGEVHYRGTMPLGGQRPLRDCLVGIHGELESRWMIHPDTGLTEVVEVYADQDEDPAELWIQWMQVSVKSNDASPGEASYLPEVLTLKYGLEDVIKLRVESWDAESALRDDKVRVDSGEKK